MRWRVLPGQVVTKPGVAYGGGEEFDATADEAKQWDGLIEKVDPPKSEKD